MWSKFETIHIETLFQTIDNRDMARLKIDLTPNDVNTVNSITLHHYGSRYAPQPYRGSERIDKYLLHEAIRKRFIAAVILILEKGGDLLIAEEIQLRYFHKETHASNLVIEEEKIVLPTALDLIEESQDQELIKIAFDHICIRKLYLEKDKPHYAKFIRDFFTNISSPYFSAPCLCMDVGQPLPNKFTSIDELKAYLIAKNHNLTDIFFTKQDYFNHFLRGADKQLLAHALPICAFELDELHQIYATLQTDELKTLIVDRAPEVDREFAEALATMREKANKLREVFKLTARPANPPPPPPPRTTAESQLKKQKNTPQKSTAQK
nr:hypothetical protein [Pseudomonadota bacterium]